MSCGSNCVSESTLIHSIESEVKSVNIRIKMTNGLGIIIRISNRGFEFYGRESSSGGLYGSKILKTPDQIFEWIAGEIPEGGKKPFGEKSGLKGIGRKGS